LAPGAIDCGIGNRAGWSGAPGIGQTVTMKKLHIVPIACALSAACHVDDQDPASFRSIEPVCIEDGDVPAGAWECSEPLVIDCNDASVPDEIYVRLDAGQCDEVALQDIDGPFPPGSYDIVVVDGNDDAALCSTQLTVNDALAPVVETERQSMWPPNHKYHDITLADCIVDIDDCDDDWTATIDWVSSDEPDDDNGDGNTDADVVIVASDAVSLRSERQGGSNGRVYTIGFTVTDGSGNASAAECEVVVDHDNGKGGAVDDGEAYRVEI
jgi:hypothetical protein